MRHSLKVELSAFAKTSIQAVAQHFGARLMSIKNVTYDSDGMTIRGKHAPFRDDPKFMAAYTKGIATLVDPAKLDTAWHFDWRAAVCVWAAQHGLNLEGDFVECGVNTGVYSLTICNNIDFNETGKTFYLFDTFNGIPQEQITVTERAGHEGTYGPKYEDCYDAAVKNFAPFPRAHLIRGKVPDTLSTVQIDKVCYLSIDMNIAYPERKAIEHFWPKLSHGAVVVLDDYGWFGYEEQRRSMDEFAASVGVTILASPTGQGLMIKP